MAGRALHLPEQRPSDRRNGDDRQRQEGKGRWAVVRIHHAPSPGSDFGFSVPR